MRKTGSPLAWSQRTAPASAPTLAGAEDADDSEAFQGWVKTWTWTLAGVVVYIFARWLVELCYPADPLAYAELFNEVPLLVYQMSSTAFFTALILNLTSLMFEESATRRQLALLSCAIKGAACHTDMLLVTGRAHVIFDRFGSIVIPQRYVQWLVTTPTMVYILSKISDLTPMQTATAIGMDVIMVLSGFSTNFLPGPYLNWTMFSVSMFSFMGVLYMMGLMVYSAVKEHTSASSRRSLLFIYMCTLFIWNLFPLAWVLHVVSNNMAYAEYLNVFANFMAKVLFSSSIMYGNYMTIAQRRLLAQRSAENAHRVRMIQDLKDAVMRKDQFMSLMSHELRTPLNGIIQLSDALVRGAGGEMNPKGQHFVKTIKNSSNHLLNIINDILDVAALKEGKLTIKHELVSLAKAVEHVVDIVAPLAKKDVAIERCVDSRTPFIIADFSRVIQILYNLAGNALKFTHKGRVSVRVAPSPDGSSVTVEVADTGIGIPMERVNGIWGAFEQVDMSVTRKYGGTGLGLNIVKQLVEAHDGSIEVNSAEGRGTTFTVTLPVLQSNTRQSLEVQVMEGLNGCGLTAAQGLAKKRARRQSNARGSIEEAISQLARGLSSSKDGALGGNTNTSGASGQGPEVVLYRRRTQELERENFMGELQRRTEHKRSLEEAQMASRQLVLSEPERRAERDSRSLESLDEHLASGVSGRAPVVGPSRSGLPMRGRQLTDGDSGGGGAGGGGGGGSYHPWHAEAPCSARPSASTEPNLPSSTVPGSLTDMYEHLQLVHASTDSAGGRYSAGGGGGGGGGVVSSATLARKLSNVSASGKTAGGAGCGGLQGTPSWSLRMSTYGRGGHGVQSGPAGLSTSGSTHLLLKTALESDLYRQGRDGSVYDDASSVYDNASSVGADSEWDVLRCARRPGPKGLAAAGPLPQPRSGKLLQTCCGGSRASLSLNSGGGGGGGSGGCAAAVAAAAPPPGITMDKLAYSDIYGSIQILSVDDEEVNQIVLEEILTSSGYQFARCMDGLEALEWLCASDTMPDLILLDCMMPNMSGHEFCATLRKVIPGNVLPVIMVSAKSDEDNIVEGLRSGSNDFVRKPYQREELLARIETQLRLKNDSWWLAELVNNVDGRETESMKLLKNILPESIIARMQQGQKFVADSHGHVVILFSDIVGFTNLSSKLPTAEVFLMLSNMFTAFDKLTDRFSVYKVETIGDAYMVAAGHDEDDEKAKKGSPLMRVLGFARAMLDVVRNITAPNGERMRIRIGVHCGPAFAGVIGMKCPRYCFLGDTVNTASRMESTGFPMCIHVSENVYRHHPNPEAELQEVGIREVKGKGRMRTYLVRVGAWEQALLDYVARQQAAAAVAAAAAAAGHQSSGSGGGADPAAASAVGGDGGGGGAALKGAAGAKPGQLQQNEFRLEAGRSRDLSHSNSFDSCASGLGPMIDLRPAGSSPLMAAAASMLISPSRSAGAGAVGAQSHSAGQLSWGPDGCAGRFIHHLSTVTEESSRSSSPLTQPGAVGVSGGTGPSPSRLAPAGVTAAAATGSGLCSSLSRSEGPAPGSGQGQGQGGKGLSFYRSAFGSEALYCEDSSEDSAASTQNGVCTITSMLRSHSGSLTGIALPGGCSSGVSQGPGGKGSGSRGGGGSAAAATAADRSFLRELFPSINMASARTDGGGGGGTGVGGDVGAVAASMVSYLEQRIASLASQLVAEAAARQRLQEELDAERRRAANALQHMGLLQQRMRAAVQAEVAGAAAAAGPPSRRASSNGQDLVVHADAPPAPCDSVTELRGRPCPMREISFSGEAAAAWPTLPGGRATCAAAAREQGDKQQPRIRASDPDLEEPGHDHEHDDIVLLPDPVESAFSADAAGDSGQAPSAAAGIPAGGDGQPASPFVTAHMEWRSATRADFPVAVAGGRGSDGGGCGEHRRGPRPPSGARGCALWVEPLHPAGTKGGGEAGAGALAMPPSPPMASSRAAVVVQGAVTATMSRPLACRRLPGSGGAYGLQLRAVAVAAPLDALGPASKGGDGSRSSGALAASWALPRYSVDQLFEELGLVPYLPRFQEEAIRLDMLLGMDVGQLERLGLKPLGYCIRLREAVVDLARGLLRACEEAAMMAAAEAEAETET